MARLRRASVIEASRQRLAGFKQIDPAPDFGGNLNAACGQAVITDCAGELDSYNQNVAALNEQQNLVDAKEDTAAEWNKRVLAAVGAKYGTDSSEYEMVGGPVPANAKNQKRKAPAALSHQRLN